MRFVSYTRNSESKLYRMPKDKGKAFQYNKNRLFYKEILTGDSGQQRLSAVIREIKRNGFI
ncbi:MAG: hypothetical protein OXJ52_02395 [Oligoflexia bacterium]|nr:hypothetical protein [Oligoflexia bacterium]